MPAVTGRRRTTNESVPTRVSARLAAIKNRTATASATGAAQASKSEPMVNPIEDVQCPVCMDNLSSKRSLQFLPCSHSFHRTCAIKWLEVQKSRHEHSCPLCRTHVDRIKANGRESQNQFLAFGQPQPSSTYLTHALREQNGGHLDQLIESLAKATKRELAKVYAHRSRSIKERRGRETDYVNDIRDELQVLKERVKIFEVFNEKYSAAYRLCWEQFRIMTVKFEGLDEGQQFEFFQYVYGVGFERILQENGNRELLLTEETAFSDVPEEITRQYEMWRADAQSDTSFDYILIPEEEREMTTSITHLELIPARDRNGIRFHESVFHDEVFTLSPRHARVISANFDFVDHLTPRTFARAESPINNEDVEQLAVTVDRLALRRRSARSFSRSPSRPHSRDVSPTSSFIDTLPARPLHRLTDQPFNSDGEQPAAAVDEMAAFEEVRSSPGPSTPPESPVTSPIRFIDSIRDELPDSNAIVEQDATTAAAADPLFTTAAAAVSSSPMRDCTAPGE